MEKHLPLTNRAFGYDAVKKYSEGDFNAKENVMREFALITGRVQPLLNVYRIFFARAMREHKITAPYLYHYYVGVMLYSEGSPNSGYPTYKEVANENNREWTDLGWSEAEQYTISQLHWFEVALDNISRYLFKNEKPPRSCITEFLHDFSPIWSMPKEIEAAIWDGAMPTFEFIALCRNAFGDGNYRYEMLVMPHLQDIRVVENINSLSAEALAPKTVAYIETIY